MANVSTILYAHLVVEDGNGRYNFRTNLSKQENQDLYTITTVAINKNILTWILMGDPTITKTANGTLLWKQLDRQILHPKSDYLTI